MFDRLLTTERFPTASRLAAAAVSWYQAVTSDACEPGEDAACGGVQVPSPATCRPQGMGSCCYRQGMWLCDAMLAAMPQYVVVGFTAFHGHFSMPIVVAAWTLPLVLKYRLTDCLAAEPASPPAEVRLLTFVARHENATACRAQSARTSDFMQLLA